MVTSFRADHHLASFNIVFDGIRYEIGKQLFHLRSIRLDQRKGFGQIHLELNPFWISLALQELHRVGDDAGEIEQLLLSHHSLCFQTAEFQKIVDEERMGPLLCPVQHLTADLRIGPRKALQVCCQIPLDCGQRGAQLMRDHGNKLRLYLVDLREFGNIAQHAHHTKPLPVIVPDYGHVDHERARLGHA